MDLKQIESEINDFKVSDIFFPKVALYDDELTEHAINLLILMYKHKNFDNEVLLTQKEMAECLGIRLQRIPKLLKQLDVYVTSIKMKNRVGGLKKYVLNKKLKMKFATKEDNETREDFVIIPGDFYNDYIKQSEIAVNWIKFLDVNDRLIHLKMNNFDSYLQHGKWSYYKYKKLIENFKELGFIGEETIQYPILKYGLKKDR